MDDIKRLIELVEQSQIDELEVRRWWSTVRIAKDRRGANGRSEAVAGPVPAPAPAPVVAPGPGPVAPVAPQAGAAEHVHQAGLVAIVSPMVGTYYASPSPTAPPYVKVGDRVAPGQVVCIIEAMKLMNEIEAEISGTIADILIENQQPVEFNQPLFLVRPGA